MGNLKCLSLDFRGNRIGLDIENINILIDNLKNLLNMKKLCLFFGRKGLVNKESGNRMLEFLNILKKE